MNIDNTHTSCKDCIFAEYKENTQIDCNANRLSLFRKHGEVIEVFDEEKEFFVINKKHCFYKRPSGYFKGPYLTWFDQIEKENEIKYQAVIFANESMEDILRSISQIYEQSIKPCKISIVRLYTSCLYPEDISLIFNDYKTNKWEIRNMSSGITNPHLIEDLIIATCPLPYILMLSAGQTIPNDTIYKINYNIHNKFLHFALLDLGQSMYFKSTIIHKLYHGNKEQNFIDKMKEQCPTAIIPINQIYPNFPK